MSETENGNDDSDLQISGPVQLRRERCADTTADQRLLDRRGPTDWRHTDPWRVMRIQGEFVDGFDALAEMPRAVTVFGSARTTPHSPEYRLGEELGVALVRAGYAVITGGGPGAMEAANRGASESGGYSVGLGIELPFEQGMNDWVDLGVNFSKGNWTVAYDELLELYVEVRAMEAVLNATMHKVVGRIGQLEKRLSELERAARHH